MPIDILLINPVYEFQSKMTPLSIISLASALKQNNFNVKILDSQIFENSNSFFEELVKIIKSQHNLKLIGISTNSTCSVSFALDTMKVIKKVNPNIHITIGGVHATFLVEDLISYPNLDSIILYEGEESVIKLASFLFDGRTQEKLTNIWLKHDKKISKSKITGFIKPETIPTLDLSFIEHPELYDCITIMTSRGCPYNCHFCSNKYFWNQKVRNRPIGHVLEEINNINEKFPEMVINIADDSFIINRKRFKKICEGIINIKLNNYWMANIRADSLNLELAKLMKESKCKSVLVGCETVNQKSLNILQKGLTPFHMIDATKILNKVEIGIETTWMIGLPYQNEKDCLRDIAFAKKLKTEEISFGILTPFPGTEIARFPEKFGIKIISKDWDLYSGNSAVVETKWMSQNTIKQMWLKWLVTFKKHEIKNYLNHFK